MAPRIFRASERVTLVDVCRAYPAAYIGDAWRWDSDEYSVYTNLPLDCSALPTTLGKVAIVVQRKRDGAGHLTINWGEPHRKDTVRVLVVIPTPEGADFLVC